MFGNGCKFIGFQVIPDDSQIYSVYAIIRGGSHGGMIEPPTGCVIDRVEDKSSGLIENYMLVSDRISKSYLCSRDLFSPKPEMGLLGDLQILNSGDIHFSVSDVHCVADHSDKAICRYNEPFVRNIIGYCEDISTLAFNLEIDTVSHSISWRQSGEAIVDMKCDRRLALISL